MLADAQARLRLAFVSNEYVTEASYCGGLANYLGRVTVALAAAGHDVHVFTKSNRDEVIDHAGVHVHRVVPWWDRRHLLDRADRFFKGQWYSPYQDLKLARTLYNRWKTEHSKHSFDLVQVANVMAVGMFFRRVRDIPVVTRLSSYRPLWDTSAGVPITRGVRTRWRMEKTAIRGIRHTYAPTHHVARLTEKNYGIAEVSIIETPFFNECDTPDSSIRDQTIGDRPYVLFFGRMTQMKGVDVLADALSTVMSERADLHAVFVGPDARGPSGGSMRDDVLTRLSEHRSRTHLLDRLPHSQLYPFIENARVVAIPSRTDNLPNTCLEAMGLGRVVVATTGSCFEQLIEDGRTGYLVSPDSSCDLASALTVAWDMKPETRQSMGDQAAQRIAKLHPDQAIPALVEYFRGVIVGHSSGEPVHSNVSASLG